MELERPVPEPFLDQPELFPESIFYWSAFCDLSTERQLGMGVGPIPWSVVHEYALEHEVDFERLWGIIRAMDAVHLKHLNSSKDKKDDMVPITDTRGMKRVMENLKQKRNK